MRAAPRAGCGAALLLWTVSSCLCRAWTAPSTSRGEAEDALREPETEKALSSSLHTPWTSAGTDHAALPGPLLLPVH
nr:contactin-associated protein-like 2 [Pongo pygmaeus]